MANMCPCTLGNSVAGALFNLQKAKKLSEKGPELTDSATVLSRRVDTCYDLMKSDSSWAYLVNFKLEDGQEIELKTTEADFKKLKEGLRAAVTWQDGALLSFVIELG